MGSAKLTYVTTGPGRPGEGIRGHRLSRSQIARAGLGGGQQLPGEAMSYPSHRGRREQGAREVSSHLGPNRRQGWR